MTLGLNKTKQLFSFNKNDSKKRKIDEVMNGLTEDNIQTIGFNNNNNNNNNNIDQRLDEISYETPSKRSRNSLTTNFNSKFENRSFGLKSFSNNLNPMTLWNNIWKKINGKPDSNSRQELPTIETKVNNSLLRMTSNSNSIESNELNNHLINNRNEVFFSKSNAINITKESFLSTQNKSEVKRKRRFNSFHLNEKRKYQQLLNRHFNPVWSLRSNNKKSLKKPELIDLSSTVSSSIRTSYSRHSTQEEFKRELLDTNTGINLIDRIKSAGIVARPLIAENKTISTPIGSKSSQNTNVFSIPNKILFNTQNNLKTTQQLNDSAILSTDLLPESSKKFKELVTNSANYLETDWVLDLKKDLIESTERNEQKISKSERILLETKNKRETDVQNLSGKFRAPVTRTEFYPFIPYIETLDTFDEEEEESEDDVEEEGHPSDLPTLTPDMDREIDNALRPNPPNEVLCEGFSVQICRKDMETLKGLNWLNDEIINFYLSLMVERGKNDNFSTVYAFNTFFYKKLKDNGPQSLKRWTRKVDIFANDYIFIPIHLGMHWCLAVIDFLSKKIQYYDSMGGKNNECVEALKAYLQAESLDKKKKEFPMTDWSLEMVKDIPQQMNGSDCGMFTCKYAEYISRKAKINFTQAHMPYFRRRMVYEIINKMLL